MKLKLVPCLFIVLILTSCKVDLEDINSENQETTNTEDIKSIKFPKDFNFNTTEKIQVDISVKSLTDKFLPNVKVSFYTNHPDFEGKYISSAFTDNSGRVQTEIMTPSYLEELFVQVHSIGFANQKTVKIAPQIKLEFGGKPNVRNKSTDKKSSNDIIPISGNYYYMGNFTSGSTAGLPNYLENNGDNLSQTFLDDVNASLPEQRPVPTNNPEYLTSGNELDVVVKEKSDVWITFVTEGAGYKNSLGYYVFDTNNPPSTASEIDSIFVVLPNASLKYSGGELQAGDKINIGTFEAGKTISWVLFQNAWTGNGVNVNATKFYSRIDFNTTESNANKRQHTVQLKDIGRQLLLNAFEDLPRSSGSSDDDFNDLVFYVSANPWEAIEIDNVPDVKPKTDSDGDGVSDDSDDYPNDSNRAVKNTYTGTLAFEDLWPSQGDYDFNDLVIGYNIDHVLNGNNKIVAIEADWTIKAVGAAFKNGFGFKFDGLNSSDILSISGQRLKENIISTNANGTEMNQSKATVIIFDNVFNEIKSVGGAFINTVLDNPLTPTVTISSNIEFSSPIPQNLVGLPPYNPFIFVNGDRTKEIHLSNQTPTDLADVTLFGTFADATNISNNYFYKTANGLPWAINIHGSFDYPIEKSPIDKAYLNFKNWGINGGNSFKEWYLDTPSNRDNSKIFK